jgi:hypothetical protein
LATEAASGRGDEARRHAEAPAARIREREHGRTDGRLGPVGPLHGLDGVGLDRDDRQVSVRVESGHHARRPPSVREGDPDLLPPDDVGVRQDQAFGDDHARAEAADPNHLGADLGCQPSDRPLDLF